MRRLECAWLAAISPAAQSAVLLFGNAMQPSDLNGFDSLIADQKIDITQAHLESLCNLIRSIIVAVFHQASQITALLPCKILCSLETASSPNAWREIRAVGVFRDHRPVARYGQPASLLSLDVRGPGRGFQFIRFAISFSLLGITGRLQDSNDCIRDNPE